MISKIFFAFLTFYVLLAEGDGGLDILKAPNYVKFVATKSRLQSFDLPHLVFNLFGLPNVKLTKWDGLLAGSVFKRPKAVVMITIPMTQPITSQKPLMSYDLIQNSGELNTEYIRRRLEEIDWVHPPLILHSSIDNMLLDVKSSYDEISSTQSAESILEVLQSSHWLENHKTGSLTNQSESYTLFLGQLYSITQSLTKIKTSNLNTKTSPAFIHLDLSSIHPFINSPSHHHSLALLDHVMKETSIQLEELFGDNVVMATVNTVLDSSHDNNLRQGRQLKEAANGTKIDYKKAPKYSPNYPVIFNIILWLSVTLVLSLVAISWSIWNMDPGKDSVIYRMTTQRLKRD